MSVVKPQRLYQAACPGCGAPVEFFSKASTHAVCSYCKSSVVRHSDALERIGKVAELFEDYSGLNLWQQGQFQGQAFTLIGRIQYTGDHGLWTEWLALLDDGSQAILSEDNGSFVWATVVPTVNNLPAEHLWVLGANQVLQGKTFSVTSIASVLIHSAQGELAKLPTPEQSFTVVELRDSTGSVLSIDYGAQPPLVYQGRRIELDDLKLIQSASSTSKLAAEQFNCPNCASPIHIQLSTSKSISCPACKSLIDISQGIGRDLSFAIQREPIQPQIPIGSSGTYLGKTWQVVGYQHRSGTLLDDDDTEHFGWEEYLLYNAKAGFQFLVDSTDGWSMVKPATGAPKTVNDHTVSYLETRYKIKERYHANTTYAAGEFYWPVKRDDKSIHADYRSGKYLLNQESSQNEITWSVGTTLEAKTVADIFKFDAKQTKLLQRGAQLFNFSSNQISRFIFNCICIILLFLFIKSCDDDDCENYYDPNSNLTVEQQREQCRKSTRSSSSSSRGSSAGWGHK